jgi:hypothetical protein
MTWEGSTWTRRLPKGASTTFTMAGSFDYGGMTKRDANESARTVAHTNTFITTADGLA